MKIGRTVTSIALFLVMASSAYAAESKHESDAEEGRQRLALFLGTTRDGGDSGFTVGLEYEYRVSQAIGVGGLIDRAGGDFDSTLLAGAFFFHFGHHWVALLAPGMEFNEDDELALRAGFAYEFKVAKRFNVAPAFNIDFIDGEERLVYGVNLGWTF
ncbi:MAG: hypothetical protein GTO41_16405 [Burkholderiales bacterium]|nr:hypothetical protein [Burkholderiales bacterium]